MENKMGKKMEIYDIDGYGVMAKSLYDAGDKVLYLLSMGKGPGDYSKEDIDYSKEHIGHSK